jgi:hypothetical protein
MTSKQLLDEIESLPGDAKRLVVELVGVLRRGPMSPKVDAAGTPRDNPADSEFVGMWKDRDDLTDEWLRELRRSEWRVSE